MNRGMNTLAEEVNYTHFHYLITFLSCTDAAYAIHGEVTKMESRRNPSCLGFQLETSHSATEVKVISHCQQQLCFPISAMLIKAAY